MRMDKSRGDQENKGDRELLFLVSGTDENGNPKTKERILAEVKAQLKAKGIDLDKKANSQTEAN
jgi:hypothetical protein